MSRGTQARFFRSHSEQAGAPWQKESREGRRKRRQGLSCQTGPRAHHWRFRRRSFWHRHVQPSRCPGGVRHRLDDAVDLPADGGNSGDFSPRRAGDWTWHSGQRLSPFSGAGALVFACPAFHCKHDQYRCRSWRNGGCASAPYRRTGRPICCDIRLTLYWSAVINGVLAPPVMVLLMLLVRKEQVMGKLIVAGWLYWTGWIATVAMALSIVGMAASIAIGQ